MKYAVVFLVGALGYGGLEILWRGYTHWTMALTGGSCLLVIYFLNISMVNVSIWKRCLLGSAVITVFELAVGIAVNIILKWNVWDYSKIPFNFMGQICLGYSVLWFVLCIPVIWLCNVLNNLL